MKSMVRHAAMALVLAGVGGGTTFAGIIVTQGPGTAVTFADRSTGFDDISTGTDLTNYSSNSLSVTVPALAFTNFDPTAGSGLGGFDSHFHYPSAGANGATRIATTDAMPIYAVEFNVGNGFSSQITHFRYEAFSGVVSVGSGAFDVTSGTVLGFRTNSALFDSLYIGAYHSLADAQAADNTSFQAVALDNLRVQLSSPGVATPEPSTLAGAGLAIVAGLAALRRGKAKQTA